MWDACGAGYITFNANEVVKPDENETEVNMAFIIENSVILSAMAQRMQELKSNVHVRYSSRIKDIQFPNEKVSPAWNGLQGEWPSGLYSLRQTTEVKVGRVRSDSGWMTSDA